MIADPPPWPHGAKAAVAITFDVDTDSALHYTRPADAHLRLNGQTWARYDRVAIPRIVKLYNELGLRQTFFVPGWCIEHYPEIAGAVVEGGQELAIHGYIHELGHEISRELEEELLGRTFEAAVKLAGTAPLGWRAPLYSFSNASAELLAAAGLAYDSSLMNDDVPYLLQSAGGELVELPIDTAGDDWAQYAHTYDYGFLLPIQPPRKALEVYRAEIDAAVAFGGMWIGVFHPFISGRPSRLAAIRGLLEELLERGDVWVTSLDAIAAHVRELMAQGTWSPRRERVPYYSSPVAELGLFTDRAGVEP